VGLTADEAAASALSCKNDRRESGRVITGKG
jgi:hypothetical protein